jgi:polyhydroxyalkanoate synthase
MSAQVSTAPQADSDRSTMPCKAPPQEAPPFASALRALSLPLQAWAAQRLPLLEPTADGDEDPSLQLAEVMDRSLHYLLSRFTLGLSPMALAEAYFDWLIHLSLSPGKQLQLWHKGLRKSARLAVHLARCAAQGGRGHEPCISPLPQDNRFSGAQWQQWPYNVIHQTFLLQQQWWHNAATGVRGVTAHHERVLEFTFRQVLDIFAPSNFVLTNPEIWEKTQAEAGQNLVRGFWNFVGLGARRQWTPARGS